MPLATGWYRCVDSIMTVLLQTPELKSTAAIVLNAGLVRGGGALPHT